MQYKVMKDYKKILEGVVNIINTTEKSDIGFANICAYIGENCPELKESEDENVEKAIFAMVYDSDNELWGSYGVSKGDVLAWLEKQGEQNLANKVEPKFNEGDWIVHHGTENIYQVVAVIDNQYQLKYGDAYTVQKCADVDRCARLWDFTKDAKDGDVLVHSSFMFDDFIFIYNNTSILQAYCYYSNERNRFIIEDRGHHCPWNMQEVTPATKGQRDLLFQKMKEAGYEWSSEKKELKKIEDEEYNGEDYGIDSLFHAQRILEKTLGSVDGYQSDDGILEHRCAISAVKKLYEHKPAWSEEDEKIAKTIINEFEQCSEWCCANGLAKEDCIAWLNRQIHAKWSEEDKKKVNNLYVLLDQMVSFNMLSNKDASEFKDWLKSLKDRYAWKPSDEQMEALAWALSLAKNCGEECAFDLRTLQEELTKLREK